MPLYLGIKKQNKISSFNSSIMHTSYTVIFYISMKSEVLQEAYNNGENNWEKAFQKQKCFQQLYKKL